MLKSLLTVIAAKVGDRPKKAPSSIVEDSAPTEITIDGLDPFPIASHVANHHRFPVVDWTAVMSWLDGLTTPDLQARAWAACERAWLLRFRDALGPDYRLAESNQAAVLSSLEPKLSRATLEMMERMLRRIVGVLNGIAQVPPWGKHILIVFDDQDGYYEYMSYYYPESGEFAFSSGMHIGSGCSHFVTVKSDLHAMESVIAHEMTHGVCSHLPLPLWLNEGIAVNTERRLTESDSSLYSPQEMREKHLRFWRETEIQEFWSGKSFYRIDDGNSLSYDLARIMVEQMSKNWERFRDFVLTADRADAGAGAAQKHLGVDLGAFVCALLEKEPLAAWAPDPQV